MVSMEEFHSFYIRFVSSRNSVNLVMEKSLPSFRIVVQLFFFFVIFTESHSTFGIYITVVGFYIGHNLEGLQNLPLGNHVLDLTAQF